MLALEQATRGARQAHEWKGNMKSSSIFLPAYGKSYQFVDAAQPGDICALLIPGYSEAALLKTRLKTLKTRFGGDIASPLHLTCQRFRAEPEELERLKPRLICLASRTPTIALEAKSIEPFYSTFHDQELLKCRIESSKLLQDFVETFNQELEDMGITPHFPWVSELVTLLENIQVSRLQIEEVSETLFYAQRLVLTQIKAPGRYKALFSVSLSSLLEPSLKS